MARVLLVEDDAAIREMITLALTESGHEVETAPDGQAALEAVAAYGPDVIVLDYLLPRLDGREVVARLGESALRSTPVILCTALSARDVEGAEFPPAVTPLYKPFDLIELLELVARLGDAARPLPAGDPVPGAPVA